MHARALHGLAVKEVTRGDVARVHEKVTELSGAVSANRVLNSLSTFFVWAIGKGHREDNPAAFVPKNGERSRTRVLSDDEIRKMWQRHRGAGRGRE